MPSPEHTIAFAYQGIVISSAAENHAEQSDLVLLLREENVCKFVMSNKSKNYRTG